MRRYFFYLAVTFAAFVIGSSVTFWFYSITPVKPIVKEETKIAIEIQPAKNVGTGYGFGTSERRLNVTSVDEPKTHKAICRDKKLLPIWNELKKDKEFQERADEFYQTGDCRELIEVDRIDLNGDGRKEFIVWGRYTFSGATGNSVIWIYEQKGGKFKQLLQAYAYNDESKWFEVKKNKTRGYRNLVLKGHSTAYETTHSFYKFDGVRYVERKCFFEIYSTTREKPTIKTCEEYSEETERQLRESEKQLKNQ